MSTVEHSDRFGSDRRCARDVRRLTGGAAGKRRRGCEPPARNRSANEELRAANEELQSINEEYRSTSEELETSKEELQSINEELQTVNSELKLKLEAVSRAHSDLQNLMAATDFGTLFLDSASHQAIYPAGHRFVQHHAERRRPPDRGFRPSARIRRSDQDAETVLTNLTPINVKSAAATTLV